ncbi:uncharacterized protein PG986_008750 [Apiospora aurea]|uniref:Uncharacterized protein n=1 Tax=Apiospora aurea TaxID=335848 RepID=A0ABR1Q661_9PEZI
MAASRSPNRTNRRSPGREMTDPMPRSQDSSIHLFSNSAHLTTSSVPATLFAATPNQHHAVHHRAPPPRLPPRPGRQGFDPPLTSRDTYDRKGSAMCGSATMQVKYCDEAVNSFLIRDDAYRYRPDVYNRCAGACSGQGARGTTVTSGCHVSVEGDAACRRSGNQMWQDYQDLRANGAGKCGSKHWDQWDNGGRSWRAGRR